MHLTSTDLHMSLFEAAEDDDSYPGLLSHLPISPWCIQADAKKTSRVPLTPLTKMIGPSNLVRFHLDIIIMIGLAHALLGRVIVVSLDFLPV